MIKSTKYFDEIMHQKAKKYLQFWERITKVHLLTCLKSFLHEFTEKCFAAFKWCTIYDELFLWYGWPTKGVKPYFQPGPLSEILTIANLRHAASRIWTSAEPEFRLCWMKLCSSDNHYTTVPPNVCSISLLYFSGNLLRSFLSRHGFKTLFKLRGGGKFLAEVLFLNWKVKHPVFHFLDLDTGLDLTGPDL